ncbi:hypothetical protein RJ640_003380 [Escallonia rubra]|uniref:Pentatricopeptide repeat-containing protein n=1 Tax=Escallonia rubra TaxID=112253 RepID=A0AA88QB59_9ASTE|nr:hypothetical protein RJ640_003380 [Escallonia rubra]
MSVDIEWKTEQTPISKYEILLETRAKLRSLSGGRSIHDRLRRIVENPSGFLDTCLLQMYCSCGSFLDAQKVFDKIRERSDFSLVIKSSSRPQKKATAHHRRTGPRKTKPWDVRCGPPILSSKLPLLRCLSPP